MKPFTLLDIHALCLKKELAFMSYIRFYIVVNKNTNTRNFPIKADCNSLCIFDIEIHLWFSSSYGSKVLKIINSLFLTKISLFMTT